MLRKGKASSVLHLYTYILLLTSNIENVWVSPAFPSSLARFHQTMLFYKEHLLFESRY